MVKISYKIHAGSVVHSLSVLNVPLNVPEYVILPSLLSTVALCGIFSFIPLMRNFLVGIFAVIVVEFGLVSPPVGMNLFVIKGVMQNTPLQTIWFGTIPFLLTDVVRVALIIAFPAICLYLPSLMTSS